MFNGIINNLLWSQEFAVNNQVPMSNVERIEVLYGPAGAIYGPNAFSGVVNVITRDARDLPHGSSYFDYNVQAHSYTTTAFDLAAGGRFDHLSYSVAAKLYESEGADLSDYPEWGFLRQAYLDNEAIWGPVLQRNNLGKPYGEYYSPDKEQSIIAELNWHNITFGLNHWQTRNGYGLKVPFDKAQPNGLWSKRVSQWYIKHQANINEHVSVKSFLKQRDDRRWGDWAEATSDWREGWEGYSFNSISNWNVESNAWKFRQDWQYVYSTEVTVLAGLKYEHKQLTRTYDVCGYWSASYCSSTSGLDQGPEGFGLGVYHSTFPDPIPLIPGPLSEIPNTNLISTHDQGAYVQTSLNKENWVYSAAIRWDDNSEYGSFVKPRFSAIHHLSDDSTVKFIYGTAFQEPGPILLYGGWNGRRANADLKPEEIVNYELIWLYQMSNWSHDISIYLSKYEHVIKEQAENAGEREITGFEYRGRFQFENFISDAPSIEGYVNYTFTDTMSNITYDHQMGAWIGSGIDACTSGEKSSGDIMCRSVNEEIGDIAPHKLNVGVNIPITHAFFMNLRANYVSERTPYLRNTLRANDTKIDSYIVANANFGFEYANLRLDFTVNNLFNTEYYHPGILSANSGDAPVDAQGNLSRYDNGNLVRSQGFQSSVIPQLERNFSLSLSMSF
jgi:iron complex outermembrane receptor protein